jgi:hypothetical protein
MHWTLPDLRALAYSEYLELVAWVREQSKARPQE